MPPYFSSGAGDMFGTFRKIAYTLLSPKFYIGIAVGLYISPFFSSYDFIKETLAYIYIEPTLLEQEQEIVKRETGDYFSDLSNPDYQIHTYEGICKGYVVIETKGNETISTGYGEKADELTYTTLNEEQYASTTEEIIKSVELVDILPVSESTLSL